MSDFKIKPTHKPIKNYYAELEKYAQHGAEFEETPKQNPRWSSYVVRDSVFYTHFNLLEVTQVATFVA